MKRLATLALSLFSSLPVFAAGFKGSVAFDDADRARHRQGLSTILATAASCLESRHEEHLKFYRRHGISAFYGDRSSFGAMNVAQRRAHVASLGKDPRLADLMKPTSCVGLTRECLGAGFAAAGQSDLWQKIDAYTRANAFDGSAMQAALRELGWSVFFWNPNLAKNAEWDEQEIRQHGASSPARGWHAYRWLTVQKSGQYYFNAVDDARSFVNFGTRVPTRLARVPFFVGVAHTGYHVFPGTFGHVIEAHSTRAITDPQTVESADFNPLATGGAPRGQYRSGLLALPPGY